MYKNSRTIQRTSHRAHISVLNFGSKVRWGREEEEEEEEERVIQGRKATRRNSDGSIPCTWTEKMQVDIIFVIVYLTLKSAAVCNCSSDVKFLLIPRSGYAHRTYIRWNNWNSTEPRGWGGITLRYILHIICRWCCMKKPKSVRLVFSVRWELIVATKSIVYWIYTVFTTRQGWIVRARIYQHDAEIEYRYQVSSIRYIIHSQVFYPSSNEQQQQQQRDTTKKRLIA